MRLKFNNKQSFSVNRRKTVKFLACSKSLFKVYSLKFKAGQSLIEVLVAFTVSVLIGVALINAGLATQKSSISARNESQATKLAQEYLEEMRAIRDTKGFDSILVPGDNACVSIDTHSSADPAVWNFNGVSCSTSAGELVTLNKTDFFRRISMISDPNGLYRKVMVTVNWTEGSNVRNVTTETVLSNWCNKNVTGANASPCP